MSLASLLEETVLAESEAEGQEVPFDELIRALQHSGEDPSDKFQASTCVVRAGGRACGRAGVRACRRTCGRAGVQACRCAGVQVYFLGSPAHLLLLTTKHFYWQRVPTFFPLFSPVFIQVCLFNAADANADTVAAAKCEWRLFVEHSPDSKRLLPLRLRIVFNTMVYVILPPPHPFFIRMCKCSLVKCDICQNQR